jgi:hypothetical protein
MLQHEGAFPHPLLATPPAPREPSAAQRALARLRSFSLDARLAAGEDPVRSRMLAAQAARLTAPRHRELLAQALGGLVLAAQHGTRPSRISPSRSAVLGNEQALRALARRVDSREPLYARGLARLERLLSDTTGPAFSGDTAALSAELTRIESELSGAPAPLPEFPSAPGPARAGSLRRLARLRSRQSSAAAPAPPCFAGSSFALPDGSWFHGRRESA